MRKLETAKILLDIGAVMLNPVSPFKYASGLLSPVYIDCRMISSFPEERRLIMDYFVEYIDLFVGKNNIDVVVGSGPSGISLATYLSEKLRLPMAYIRESAKAHGKTNKVEGIIKEGQRALLVADIFSTENHVQESVRTLKELKTEIAEVLAIFSTSLNSVEKFLEGEKIVESGIGIDIEKDKAKKLLSKKEIKIDIDLKYGKCAWTVWTSDLSFDYIKINALYHN